LAASVSMMRTSSKDDETVMLRVPNHQPSWIHSLPLSGLHSLSTNHCFHVTFSCFCIRNLAGGARDGGGSVRFDLFLSQDKWRYIVRFEDGLGQGRSLAFKT